MIQITSKQMLHSTSKYRFCFTLTTPSFVCLHRVESTGTPFPVDFPVCIQIQEKLRFQAPFAMYALVINPGGKQKKKSTKTKKTHTHKKTPPKKTPNKQKKKSHKPTKPKKGLTFPSTRSHLVTSLLGALNAPWTRNYLFLL